MLDNSSTSAELIADATDYIIVAVNSDGKVIYHNRKAEFVFVGITDGCDLFSYVSDNDGVILKHNINMAFYQQRYFDFYWHYKGRFYLTGAHSFDQGVWLFFKDISELRELTHRLGLSEYRNEKAEILNKSGYWQLNIGKRRFYFSDGMYRLLEITKKGEDYYGNMLRRRIYPEDVDFYKEKIKSILQHKIKKFSGCLRIIMPEGKIKNCRIEARQDYFNGMEIIAGVLQETESIYCRSTAQVMSLAQIAHDIKHHLQAITMLHNSKQLSYADLQASFNYHTAKIITLTDDIMATAQSSDNQHIIKYGEVDLQALLQQLCFEYQTSPQASGIKIICRLRKAIINTDAAILSRIVGNLLSNALKFAKSKIILGNTARQIWVIDDGIGISLQQQKHIFDAYYRADSSKDGNGLGLAIVNDLCQNLGIKISVKSYLSGYTIFKLHL